MNCFPIHIDSFCSYTSVYSWAVDIAPLNVVYDIIDKGGTKGGTAMSDFLERFSLKYWGSNFFLRTPSFVAVEAHGCVDNTCMH